MKNTLAIGKPITKLGMMGMTMNAGAGLFGLGGTSWKEEVLLQNGSKLVIKRAKPMSVSNKYRQIIGGKGEQQHGRR